jgi:hypothetical protein
MDVDGLIDELEDHGFDDATEERLLSKINTAYWDICAREPWPFLEKTVVLSFDDDTGAPTTSDEWPTDFRAVQVMVTTAGSSPGTKLKRMRYDDWLEAYGTDTTTGVPLVYYFIGDVCHFFPQPETTTQITMMYIHTPAALTAAGNEGTIILPVPFHQVIVDGALFKMYAMEDDTDIAPTFETYFERGIQNMREFVWRKSYDGNDTVHATDADDLGLDSSYFGFWSN